MRSRQIGLVDIVSVRFIDDDTIGHLHNPALDTLKFIPRTGQLDQQEEVHHRMNSSFALSHSYRLYKDRVESGRFTQHDGLTRLACHATQRTGSRTGTNKGILLSRELLHTGLIAQNTPFGSLATGVYGQHGKLPSLLDEMHTESIDRSTLARSGYSGNADTHGAAGMRQALLYDLLCRILMHGQETFHERDGTAQDGYITGQNAVHIVLDRQLLASCPIQVGIDDGHIGNALVHFESLIAIIIFGMMK